MGTTALRRRLAAFAGAGVLAAVAHYGVLVAGVELFGAPKVGAGLAGYLAGGVVSYAVNRRHTYASDRPHAEATPRFVVVALVGFGLTWAVLHGLVDRLGVPYLAAQLAATALVMVWSYLAHGAWTFARRG